MAVIGIDLGGTKVAAAVFTQDGDLLVRAEEAIARREAGDLVIEMASSILSRSPEQVDGVGMCVPGIYYPGTGRVWAPNIPGWDDYPLRDRLRESFGDRLNVRIESDRACCILGEIWQGAARGATDAVFLTVGTGIGAGIVSGGRILTGTHGIAGSIGWLALDRPFREGYDAFGCFEYQASGDGLVRFAREAMPAIYDGKLRRADPLTARHVFEAYEEGDELARRVVDNAVELWGMAVANLVSLLNPEKIIFGGGVFGPAVALLDRIHAEARKWAQPISIDEVTLEASQLAASAGLYGAARLAMDYGEHA